MEYERYTVLILILIRVDRPGSVGLRIGLNSYFLPGPQYLCGRNEMS